MVVVDKVYKKVERNLKGKEGDYEGKMKLACPGE